MMWECEILPLYNKATESCGNNDVDNSSTKFYLETQSEMVKKGADHRSFILFTKYNMEADKPVPVVNITPVRFIGGPSKKLLTVNIQGAWDPDRSVAAVTPVGVPV